jgi:endo-1,3-1,4-beta-glycanase ExoK
MSLSLAAQAVSSAESYTGQSYQYGRFEARIQFAPGDGVVSSFFLWKNGSEVSGAFWNELDFEKVGADCHLQTNALYGTPAASSSQTATLSSSLCDHFHTYTYEWTPDSIAWLVDGVEIRRDTGATAAAFAQNATAGMQFRFNIWPGDASFGGNFSPTILPVYQYINWVQYSSYANGTFQLAWREDFTANSVPSGWLTGNWGSPKGLSTHTPNNVGFVNGFAVLSLTADSATGIAGVSPTDPTDPSGGAPGTGGATSSNTNPGTGGTGATTTPATTGNDGGCTIAAQGRRASHPTTILLLAAAAALLRRRTRISGSLVCLSEVRDSTIRACLP